MADRPDVKTRRDRDSGGGKAIGFITLVLCMTLVAALAGWHFSNREQIGPTFGVDVVVDAPQEKVRPGVATRFTVLVEQDNKDTPLAGRIVEVSVAPFGKAMILGITGHSGQSYAKDAPRARGRTDDSGRLEVTVSATEPGEYTLVALDSASNKEGTVDFRVAAPGG